MLKKIQTHSSSLETLLHTKDHLSQLTLTTRGADPSFYHLKIMGSATWPKIIDIDDHGQSLEDIKFKLKINKDQAEEIMSYNQLMDYIQKGTDAEEDPDSLFKFRDIVAHQGPP